MDISVYEAKARLSELLLRAEEGDEVIITRHGNRVVKLVPMRAVAAPRVLGRLKGRVQMAPDFDAPLPEETLGLFENDT